MLLEDIFDTIVPDESIIYDGGICNTKPHIYCRAGFS